MAISKANWLQIAAWGTSAVAVGLAVLAWGQGYGWKANSTYQLFPLFGLLAFSLMWSHYFASALRLYLKQEKTVLNSYFEATSLLVLIALLLHPGLLAWQLWRDGQGMPPASELNYVQPALKGAVIIGMISWLVFLAYELRRKFKALRWWRYVQYASDVAMLLIFTHALRLGGQLQEGWFRGVWFFYGASLLIVLLYIYAKRYQALGEKK